MPLFYSYEGPDIIPVFWKRWHLAFLLDTFTEEGGFFDSNQNILAATHYGNFFYGTGVELRADITLAYNLDGQIQLGLYDGLNNNAYGGITLVLRI